MQMTWNADRGISTGSVDAEKGEIVSDGQRCLPRHRKDYGDFEMYVDWLMVNHNGDSGIYLRGYPQVQIWDVDNPREVKNGAPRKDRARLWNDNPDNPGKWPLVKADKPVGSMEYFPRQNDRHPRVGVVQRQADRGWPGARQLFRPQNFSVADRPG